MERKTRNGYLILADISGYTFFLANTELEHADKAIGFLLETIIGQLDGPLTISKLEGDAVFAYAEPDHLPGGTLIHLLDDTYLAFRSRAEALYRGNTCPCKACLAIPTLDLKFIVHRGDFVLQQVAGITDLLGSDVNLAHKLLKNHVVETTGVQAYALFTGQALENMQMEDASFIPHRETYEHLGEVMTQVTDLHLRMQGRNPS